MKIREIRSFVTVGLVALQLGVPVAQSANIPPGVPRVVEMPETHSKRGIPRVSRRFQRWLENALSRPVHMVGSGVQQAHYTNRFEVAKLMEEVRSGQPSDKTIEKLLQSLEKVPETFGVETQEAYLWVAYYFWSRSHEAQAEQMLQKGILLHPDLSIALGSVQDRLRDPEQFRQWVSSVREGLVRGCELVLRTEPTSVRVSVNGFPMGERKHFRMAVGSKYDFQVETMGFEPSAKSFLCQKVGRWAWHIVLDPKSESKPVLGENIEGNESVFLVDTEGDRFQFYMMTLGHGLERIPTTEPVLVASATQLAGAFPMPIAEDSFLKIWNAHRMAAGDTASTVGTVQKRNPWYRDWTVWAIVGGVVGAALVGYMATRSSSVGSQSGTLNVRVK